MKTKNPTPVSAADLLPVSPDIIERRIFLFRGHKVMLDSDLAELYGVEPRAVNQAVKRNQARFPSDFAFQLTLVEGREVRRLRSQTVILKRGQHIKFAPYVFTEQGIAMLSSVLRTDRAIQVNIAIVRTFVHLREMLLSNKDLADKLAALEKRYDAKFKAVFDAIRSLMNKPSAETPTPRIGFK